LRSSISSLNIVSPWEGAWKGYPDKYLGIRIKSADQFYYGWIKISSGSTKPEIIIHDFAYRKTAGVLIKAGDKL